MELWLPRAAVDASAAKAKKNPDHAEGETLPPCRILLVDDHPGVRETTAALLQDMGHTVSQAEDAAAMLRILGSDPECCDVIVTDYAMPLVSGSEAIRRAREVRPGLPGIIITGYAEAEAVSNLPDQVIVLVKPFSHAELASALGAVSQGSEDALTQ